MTLTKKAFIQWLRGQKPGRRFRRNSGCACPIAEWVANIAPDGLFLDHVSFATITFHGGSAAAIPRWARDFIAMVDYDSTAECIRLLKGTR